MTSLTKASEELGLSSERELYRRMLLLRRFEEAVGEQYARGEIPGFTHLYLGQEAVAVGVCDVLRATDQITSTHRGHGHVLAKGSSPKAVMAELYGREGGLNGGRGGSMHLYDPVNGVMGTNGIVASGGGLACGAALAAIVKGSDDLAVAFMGDGAVDHGATHEALNFASVLNLPVIFVVENNGFSEGTPFHAHSPVASIVERSAGYGIHGAQVDGQDVIAVREAAVDAVKRARQERRPTLIEAVTRRYRGHFEGDQMDYRLPDGWQAAERDPLQISRQRLEFEQGVPSDWFDSVEEAIQVDVAQTIEFARASAFPSASVLTEKVFASGGGHS